MELREMDIQTKDEPATELQDLTDLQLALIGGGIGETSL